MWCIVYLHPKENILGVHLYLKTESFVSVLWNTPERIWNFVFFYNVKMAFFCRATVTILDELELVNWEGLVFGSLGGLPESPKRTIWDHSNFSYSTIIRFIVVVQSLSHVQLFEIPWTAARQASLSFTISQSFLKLLFIELMMPSNHLILSHPILLLPSIITRIRVFSNELNLCIRWSKYWGFNFSISPPMNIQDWFPLGWTGLISLLSKGLSSLL